VTAARAGVVYLVGAGPGDPGLMTLRAAELIASANVVLHDRLIPPGALGEARQDAELIDVGKRPGSAQMSQGEIERLMVERARAGRSVVRLKGGDPFVFGRGGEEAEALAAAAVPFEVVPGVTAGVAAPAYAGIPLTHRDDASAVAFVTAHEDPDKDGSLLLDWEALARFPGTLVLYMGVKRLPEVVERLVGAGRDAGEPAAAVERGTMAGQRRPRPALRLPRSCSPGRWRRVARRSVGSSGAPSTGCGWSSPGRVPRQAAWRRRCARSAPRSSSCRRSGSCPGSTRPRFATWCSPSTRTRSSA
jgi:uroporphyrin-III C-methyltransferase